MKTLRLAGVLACALFSLQAGAVEKNKNYYTIVVERLMGAFSWEVIDRITVDLNKGSKAGFAYGFPRQNIIFSYSLSRDPEEMIFWYSDDRKEKHHHFAWNPQSKHLYDYWEGEIREQFWSGFQFYDLKMHLRRATRSEIEQFIQQRAVRVPSRSSYREPPLL